jgi:hypothetical protein
MTRRNQCLSLTIALIACIIPPAGYSDRSGAIVPVSDFSGDGLSGWQQRDFTGRTRYTLVDTDAGRVLHARASASASALYREVDVDLGKTPCLHWQWRIGGIYTDNRAERRKEGDDYPARIYVIFDTGFGWWNRTAVNYVWSSYQAIGSRWPNAYTNKARMIAVASGQPANPSWQSRARNVVDDYRRLFNAEPPPVEAVAIMTDADDLGAEGHAWYKDLRFHAATDGTCR